MDAKHLQNFLNNPRINICRKKYELSSAFNMIILINTVVVATKKT